MLELKHINLQHEVRLTTARCLEFGAASRVEIISAGGPRTKAGAAFNVKLNLPSLNFHCSLRFLRCESIFSFVFSSLVVIQ